VGTSRCGQRRESSCSIRALPGEADEFVSVTVNPDGSISPPVVVLAGDFASGRASFDLSSDGSLLMIRELPAAAPTLQVVVNWAAPRGLTIPDP
jgi:hypothetical protein